MIIYFDLLQPAELGQEAVEEILEGNTMEPEGEIEPEAYEEAQQVK